jgi:hypothetical protein
MEIIKKVISPIFIATIWISASEFLRNDLLLKPIWINHYNTLGISFPSEIINGLVWGVWSLSFAIFIFIISQKFSLVETTFISWFGGFFLMWIALGNLSVLPFSILFFAIPLSLLETFVASILLKRNK